MVAKLVYDFSWNGGTLRVEANSIVELSKIIQDLKEIPQQQRRDVDLELEQSGVVAEYPHVPGHLGCTDAIKALLRDEWGREPRTEAELTTAMKANAIHYSHGTISGALTAMTRRGEIRRVGKKGGSYAYVINEGKSDAGAPVS